MSNVLETILMGLDTEPSGLQAAARLAGEQNKKVAELILAAVSLVGQSKILEDKVWERTRDFDLIWESQQARAEVLSKVRELSREP